MASRQSSSVKTLARNLSVFAVAIIGFAIFVQIALPWADVSSVIDLAFDFPQIVLAIVGIVSILFAMAFVDDIFS